MIIRKKLTDQELLTCIYKANDFYSKLLGASFLFVGKNRNSDYYWFECNFYKRQWMHLLGIKSRTYSSEAFFDVCNDYNHGVGKGISIEDCTPAYQHSRETINEKCSVCYELLDLKNAKYMKIGNKDKISEKVDFDYAYGSDAIIGVERKGAHVVYPKTLIPRNINSFSTQTYRILFIFQKDVMGLKYTRLHMELKERIISEHYECFPPDLKGLIESKTL